MAGGRPATLPAAPSGGALSAHTHPRARILAEEPPAFVSKGKRRAAPTVTQSGTLGEFVLELEQVPR